MQSDRDDILNTMLVNSNLRFNLITCKKYFIYGNKALVK